MTPQIPSLSRRTFFQTCFQTTAAAGALSLLNGKSAVLAASAQPARGLKIGLASYSVKKLSFDQLLAACKEADIHHVTLKDMHMPMTDTPEQLKAACAKLSAAGITIMGGGVITMKKDEVQVRKAFEYARTCGFPVIVASPEPDALDLVEAMIKEFDIRVAIHNHGPEDKVYKTPQDVLDHVKKRDKRLGACMDIGHTVRAGGDPIKSAIACGPRLFDLHMKDLRVITDKGSQVEVGRGAIDIVGLCKTLLKMKFAGHVALEYEINNDNPLPGIKESLAYMRGAVAGLTA